MNYMQMFIHEGGGVYEQTQIDKLLILTSGRFLQISPPLSFFSSDFRALPPISCCIQNLKVNYYSRHSTAEINIRLSPPCEPAMMIWSRLGPQIANEVKYKNKIRTKL